MEKQIHDIKPKAKAVPRRTVAPVPTYSDTDLDLTPKTVKRIPKAESADVPRGLMFTLQLLAYAIPLGFLAYVLYINYLPFGYEKTFTIDVGTEGDTTPGEFYLEPSPDLSERKTDPDGTTYRELNGIANVIFKPNVVLKDAEITVSVEGEGVEIIPPVIDFNPDNYEWDYEWDFTQKETAFTPKISERAMAEWKSCTTTEAIASTTATTTIIGESPLYLLASSTSVAEICEPIPVPDLVGNAFWFEGRMHFNGASSLEMPGTSEMFENGPLTIFAEWVPTDSTKNFQQIVGHYNWEILQNKDSVIFQVGRMDDQTGDFYSIEYPLNAKFFNNRNSLLAIYNPALNANDNGYIDLYINNKFVNRTYFKNKIVWNNYNLNYNLSLGQSNHGLAYPFSGGITKLKIYSNRHSKYIPTPTKNISDSISTYITSTSSQRINKIEIQASIK